MWYGVRKCPVFFYSTADEQSEDMRMALLMTTAWATSVAASAQKTAEMNRPRRIDPRSGRALEILGHAIEYLTDEFVHESGGLNLRTAQAEAIQLMVSRNREIYFSCPVQPSLRERLLAWIGIKTA